MTVLGLRLDGDDWVAWMGIAALTSTIIVTFLVGPLPPSPPSPKLAGYENHVAGAGGARRAMQRGQPGGGQHADLDRSGGTPWSLG